MRELPTVVVDASVVIEVLLGGGRGQRAAQVIADSALVAPDVIDSEVIQGLRGLERAGRLSPGDASRALRDHLTGPIRREPSLLLATRAWELRHNFSAYDAMYVSLAERLGCPVVTSDRRWARAGVEIAVITVS